MPVSKIKHYTHDCKKCIFLASYKGPELKSMGIDREWVDLYYHSGIVPTVLFRWGDDGPEYCSGLDAALFNPILALAATLALAGLEMPYEEFLEITRPMHEILTA